MSRGDKGRFRKRVVLANVPSFWFFGLVEHANVPSFRFSFWGNIRMYRRSGFRSGGHPPNLVALYRAMRLRFGYGFESCDANGPRSVKNTNVAKHRPIFLPPLLLVGSKELVLKVPKRGQLHAAICVTRKRCDSCAQVALGTRAVSRRNF